MNKQLTLKPFSNIAAGTINGMATTPTNMKGSQSPFLSRPNRGGSKVRKPKKREEVDKQYFKIFLILKKKADQDPDQA